MSRLPSSSWLAAPAIIACIGLVVCIAVPLRTCPTCFGLARKMAVMRSSGGVPGPIYRLNCPECADRGTVTLPRFLKGSILNPDVSRLLQTLVHDTVHPEIMVNDLSKMVQQSGKNPHEFTGDERFEGPFSWTARFCSKDEKVYVLVAMSSPGIIMPGISDVGVVLLSTDGKALDYVQFSCSNREASVYSQFLDQAAPDGALIVIKLTSGGFGINVEPKVEYRLYQGQRNTRVGSVDWPGAAMRDGACRIGVDPDRLHVLTPVPDPTK